MTTRMSMGNAYSENASGKSIYGSTVRDSVAHNGLSALGKTSSGNKGRTTTAGHGTGKMFVGLMRKSKKDRDFDKSHLEGSDDDDFWNPDDPHQARVIVDKSKTFKYLWHAFRLNCYYSKG